MKGGGESSTKVQALKEFHVTIKGPLKYFIIILREDEHSKYSTRPLNILSELSKGGGEGLDLSWTRNISEAGPPRAGSLISPMEHLSQNVTGTYYINRKLSP